MDRSTALDQVTVWPVEPGRRRKFAQRPAIPSLLISGLILLLVWQGLVTAARIPVWLLPSPWAVAQRFVVAVNDGTLRAHLVPTIVESIGGFFVALLAGVGWGYIVAKNRTLERWVAPYLAAIQSVPVIAIAPLMIVWAPNGLLRNILVAAMVVFFPIFSGMLGGIRSIPRELREVALVSGATRWQTLWYVDFPLALPTLFSGIRTSLAYATTGAVVAEFVGTRYGLGAMINIARGLLDMPLLFVAIFCLIVITLLLYLIVTLLERSLLTWRDV